MNAPGIAKCAAPARAGVSPEEAVLLIEIARLEERLRKANEEIGALRSELRTARGGE